MNSTVIFILIIKRKTFKERAEGLWVYKNIYSPGIPQGSILEPFLYTDFY